jgi:hypothetical protein
VRLTSAELKVINDRKERISNFESEKLAEFVCLIIMDPNSGLPHVYVYWTGTRDLSPDSPRQNFYRDRIAYYMVDLSDEKYKTDHAEVFNRLVSGLTESGGTGTVDPLSSDYRKAFFDLTPVNPPSDLGQYSIDQLKQMPIDDNSLVGWFMNQEQQSAKDQEYYNDAGKTTPTFTYRKYAGNFKVGNANFLFSQKIRPPKEILTTFIKGQSAIPAGFAKDGDADAVAAKFSLASFKNSTSYLLRYLKAFPDRVKIKITGHTDSTDTAQSNLELSRKRAYAFYNYLMTATDLGVPPLTKAEAEKQIGPASGFNAKSDLGDYIVGAGEQKCVAEIGDDQTSPVHRKITIEYLGVK